MNPEHLSWFLGPKAENAEDFERLLLLLNTECYRCSHRGFVRGRLPVTQRSRCTGNDGNAD